MKLALLFLVGFAMAGCGVTDRACSGVTGDPSEACWDGVVYLQFTSGATVKVDASGKPVACGRPAKP